MPPKTVTPRLRRALLTEILRSPTYRKAYQDPDFLGREELRPVRLELELLKPEMALSELDIRSTVVVFGSARIPAPEDARKTVREAERALRARPRDAALRARVESARALAERSRYYEEARRFAAIVSKASQEDGRRDYVIVTGGGPGIMEAANRGAWEIGAKSIGLNITLPHEQAPNHYMSPELSFRFHYFAIRKMHFMMRAKAMVAFPGGFGTFDELFETLTLVQTGKKHRFPVILFGREFWSRAVNLPFLASQGVIAHEDLGLVQYVETAQDAWNAIRTYWRKYGQAPPRRRRSLRAVQPPEEI